MRIEIKDLKGKYLSDVHINFCGYGKEDFVEVLKEGLPITSDGRFVISDPMGFFKKLQGTISKDNMGKLSYYVLVKNYPIQLNTSRW